MAGLYRGDGRVHRAALACVHGGSPGAVEVAELRVAGDVEPAPILQAEPRPAVSDRCDLDRAAVDEPEPAVRPTIWPSR